MRQIYLTLAFCVTSLFAFSGNWMNITSTVPENAQIQLVSSDLQHTVLHAVLSGFSLEEVQTQLGTAYTVSLGNATPLLAEGAPDLAKLTASILIPDQANMEVSVLNSSYRDFPNIDIAPSKGNLTRNIDPATVPYTWGNAYSRNDFYPGNIAGLDEPYLLRDYRGQTVKIFPFQYNPVSKTLRVYFDITLEIRKKGENGANPYTANHSSKLDPEFYHIYSHHFINYAATDYTPLDDHGKMLVICHGPFMSAMQPFVQWKNTIGIPTEMVDVATIGTTASAIKTYITNYYNTNGLTFVLLVGDAAQIPTNQLSSGASDNGYSYIVGNDHYPDLFVGRFSAESVTDVLTQVTRTLNYERNPTVSSWCGKSVGIGSDQGPGDDNEYDYQHIRNLQTQLMGYTYTGYSELYDGSQGGLDLPGDPSPGMVADAVNAGAGIILYTGHGSDISWGTTGFSNSNVAALNNGGMLPFIWSVACVNGNFVNGTCFAEAWMRSRQNETPIGAVATLMSTINQSWNPPMEGEDEMVAILVESYANNIKRSYGGLSMNGCMKMNDTYGSGGYEMTDTWTVFGDPSLMVRTAAPDPLTVTHSPTVFLGATQLQVNCNVDNALVCLTMNNQILGTATVTGGVATVSFNALMSIDTITVAVTVFNHVPYIGSAMIIAATGPYMAFQNYMINDPAGNNNQLADYGESIQLDMTLQNLGVATAGAVTATIATSDPYVTITDNSQAWGNINAGSNSLQSNAFAMNIAGNAPDQHTVLFTLNIQDNGGDTWTSSFSITLHAPVLAYSSMTVSDPNGNNNGKLDPGETADLMVTVHNAGSSDAQNVVAVLSTADPFVTISLASMPYGNLQAGGSSQQAFSVTAAANTPPGHLASFDLNISANLGVTGSGSFGTVIGQVPVCIIDLDGNNNSAPAMQAAITHFGLTYDYMTAFPTDLNIYSSLFVCLGVYSDNHQLSSSEGQQLADYLTAGGRLYMEGGDTWYYDPATSVHAMFNITGVSDGSSDLSSETGQAGTITAGMNFTYNGDNNWIDHLSALAPAVVIFKNQSPQYSTAVAHDAGTYKTIGASFEFGGLNDGSSPSTRDELMEKYLTFFGLTSTLSANFSASQTSLCAGGTVSFTDLSVGAPASWNWTFPGGSPAASNLQNPAVTYAGPAGVYDVKLVVSNVNGSDSITKTGYITVGEVPQNAAAITGSGSVCAGATDVTYSVPDVSGATSYLWHVPSGAFITSGACTNTILVDFPSTSVSGDVTVKGLNGCGEGGESTLAVTVNALPVVTVMPFANVCMNWPAFLLQGGSPAGGSYSGDGIAGNSFDPAAAGGGLHTITYSYTSPEGCASSASADLFVDSCLAVNQAAHECSLQVFPNPGGGQVTIDLKTGQNETIALKLFDAAGTAVFEASDLKIMKEVRLNYDWSRLARGIYYLSVERNDQRILRRLVIQ